MGVAREVALKWERDWLDLVLNESWAETDRATNLFPLRSMWAILTILACLGVAVLVTLPVSSSLGAVCGPNGNFSAATGKSSLFCACVRSYTPHCPSCPVHTTLSQLSCTHHTVPAVLYTPHCPSCPVYTLSLIHI